MTRRITVVPVNAGLPQLPRRKRVCAYVRVSTGHAEQLDSLANQTEYYERKIRARPDYESVGIFSDSGISGARANRPAFQQMLAQARAGQIDLILTKSISRFARNTVLLLTAIRELKSLGVAVEFEREQLNTDTADGEFLITVLASMAEEERKSVSANIKWSFRKRFERGDLVLNSHRFFGYTHLPDGRLVINEEQAVIVRRVFKRYLEGVSAYQIAGELTRSGVSTFSSRETWDSQRIVRMIANEKYVGDVLQQKAYIDSHGVQRLNRGQLAQFLIENHHPAIISREAWAKAQQIRQTRRRKVYPWSSLLRCALCGAVLIRHISPWTRLWECGTYLTKGKAVCAGLHVPESELEGQVFTEPMIVEVIQDEPATHRFRFTRAAEFQRPGN